MQRIRMHTSLRRASTHIPVYNFRDRSLSCWFNQDIQLELSEESAGHDACDRGIYWNKEWTPNCGYGWAVDEYCGADGKADRNARNI